MSVRSEEEVSPKVTAAALAALVAPLVVRLIAALLGIEIESEAVEGLILAVIAAASAGIAGYRKRDPLRV